MTKLVWGDSANKIFETGLDRGVLYYKKFEIASESLVEVQDPNPAYLKTFYVSLPYGAPLPDITQPMKAVSRDGRVSFIGNIIDLERTYITLQIAQVLKTGTASEWNLTQDAAVPWEGLSSLQEAAGTDSTSYYIDGRPFLILPKPKEYKATLTAYTYPDEFSSIMGVTEATPGMYLDSQNSNSFSLSYRTLVGNAVAGVELGYKIHLVYNATVTNPGANYQSLSNSITPTDFSFEIQAVPVPVAGYRSTAHVVIDTRNLDPTKLANLEKLLYGDNTTAASMPSPQVVFDILTYGDTIIITDNGDGTWTAEGSYYNIYMIGDEIFEIDNVNAVYGQDGTYTISSTNV